MTQLLQAWAAGDVDARDRLMAVLYADLRRRAAARLRREPASHVLQPTALVHEAYLRLANERVVWKNRAQFLGVASEMMRRILIDQARARLTTKRSGRWTRVTLDDAGQTNAPFTADLLDLDRALNALASFDPRKSRIAELKFFGGLSHDEIGQLLDVSEKTIERDWHAARAWLFKTLNGHGRT
ncbi:MAG TPA: ECF-type sigma factor [Vicinamibacterales bacterium]|nr:ECF-type sigma factor [Vicinamibacterales bacterium]